MYEPLLDAFDEFPDEAAIIGRLLAGFGQIEIDLMNSVAAIRDDLDTTLKAMFRSRAVTSRIRVADALARHLYGQAGLGTEFEMAVTAMQHCLQIRNQYAHCTWYDDNTEKLAFVNLEELAEKNVIITNLRSLTIHHVDKSLLKNQQDYFEYSSNCLVWVNFEARHRAGKLSSQPLAKPKQMKQPPLHSP